MPLAPARALAAMLVMSLPLAASAQQAVVYGVVDTGVETLNHVAGRGRLTRVPTLTGSVPSRLGFRVEEDLCDGLRAQVVLEGGLAADSGSLLQGGRMSIVGLSGTWGSLSVGRQFTMLFWAQLDADVIGPAVYSTASIDPYLGNPRSDNPLAWRGRWGGWSAGATWLLSRRTAAYLTAGAISSHDASAQSVSDGSPVGAAPAAGGSQTGVMAGVRHGF